MKQNFQYVKLALFGFLGAFIIHSIPMGCHQDDVDPPQPPDITLDLEKANKTAEDVEQAFASGDYTKVLPFMASLALDRSQSDLEAAHPDQLKQFAIDFDQRSIVGYGDELIEYQFTWDGLHYTVDFAIQEDGSFKIIRL